ncbi:MAG TPA: response regulator [Polyangiaceae bacterium]|nr:response regulator [Polyangiaceae bacterium]
MTAEALVLIVEDDERFRRFLRATLTSHGFRALEAATADQAIALARTNALELILLDLGLPDADGADLTGRFREWTQAPVIVVSARTHEEDKVFAFEAGADDYLTKPFGVKELVARMRVALRHAAQGTPVSTPVLEFGQLKLDVARRVVTVAGKEVHLTPIEYKCLVLLARNAGKVLTHGQILREVWGPAYSAETHYVRVRMAELRRKLERDPAQPRILLTEPGIGYRLRDVTAGKQ